MSLLLFILFHSTSRGNSIHVTQWSVVSVKLLMKYVWGDGWVIAILAYVSLVAMGKPIYKSSRELLQDSAV